MNGIEAADEYVKGPQCKMDYLGALDNSTGMEDLQRESMRAAFLAGADWATRHLTGATKG